ncbi:hypothetical protein L873DRAFT_1805753 [Choiromyces venosus 120613-1]|uniref:Uncharacterized protein n=1 Tax=Choiromyces venosus 120613-1 TaxID=1336337 RepID=A0A3N4JP26_9PEZI|nr:hypothetical protein L873DRAFT_1805753 [Choiromyces venosus 120613-1]
MARNQQLNRLLDSFPISRSTLQVLSHPLGQAYSTELFRHTLSRQLSTSTTTISDPLGNSLYGNTCHSSTSSNQIAPRHTQPRYQVMQYYKPKSSPIFFTQCSNICQPWAKVGTTSYHYTSSQTTATTTAHSQPENHILVQIPDQKWRKCAVYLSHIVTKQGRRARQISPDSYL